MLLTWTDEAVAWHRLVEALEDGREQPLAPSRSARGRFADRFGRDLANLGGALGRVVLDDFAQLVEAEGVAADVVEVDPAVARSVRACIAFIRARLVPLRIGEMEVGLTGGGVGRGSTTISCGGFGPRRRSSIRLQSTDLRFGNVMAVEGDRVGVVDVGVAAGLAVGAEAGLQRGGGRGGAEAGVAVHVRGADAGLPDHGERVVLLEEELAGGVEADRPSGPLSASSAFDARRSAPSPYPSRSRPAARLVRTSGAVRRSGDCNRLPAEQVLRIEAAVIDPVDRPAAHADHAAVLDRDVQRVAVGVRTDGGLHPPVDVRSAMPSARN